MKINVDVHDIKKDGIKFFKLKPGENSVIENITSKILQVIIMPIYDDFHDINCHFNNKKGGSKK